MLLIAELLIVLILITSMVVLIAEEGKLKKSKVSKGLLKEYWGGEERRGAFRINTSLFVHYCLEDKQHIKLGGQMKNVSSSGMQLLVNEKIFEGTLLRLEFELPELKDIIDADGRVVWSKGKFDDRDKKGRRVFLTGIKFVNIRPEDRTNLIDYIEKHSEKT